MLNLRGAFKKNPDRAKERENEPEITEPLGDAPESFNESLRARWNEIREWCPWLTVADRAAVELVCRLWQGMRDGAKPDYKSLLAGLAHLGMTPVDRSKVKVPGAKPKANKFGELAG